MSAGIQCGDNRFDLIAKAHEMLVDGTNIESSPQEMAVLDKVLYRCWQVGLLNRLETCHADETDTWECVCDGIGHYGERMTVHVMECSECGRTYEHVNGGYERCPHCGRRIVEVADG